MSFYRFLAIALVGLPLLIGNLVPRASVDAASCQYVLGFKALHDLIPQIVGDCVQDEQHNGANGDGLQATAGVGGAVGLLAWRKADNWTAYTDGYRTWVNGPNGLQERLNTERYCWEGDAASFPLVAGSPKCGNGHGLPLLISVVSPDIAGYFNQIAGATDVAMVPAAQAGATPNVSQGRQLVFFASWAQAESALPGLAASGTKVVAYDPEHWAQTPQSEQQDLVGTVARASQEVHAAGLEFLVVPDRRYATQYAAQIAPYADDIVLQGQRLEFDPGTYANWVEQIAPRIRQASPKTKIYAQVATGVGTPDQMLAAIKAVSGQVDGVALWSSAQFLSDLKQFVSLYRSAS